MQILNIDLTMNFRKEGLYKRGQWYKRAKFCSLYFEDIIYYPILENQIVFIL